MLHCELKKRRAAAKPEARKATADCESDRGPKMLSKCHPSHKARVIGDIVFCGRCGGYTEKRLGKLLANACRGYAAVAGKTLERLSQGLHPLSGVMLGQAAE